MKKTAAVILGTLIMCAAATASAYNNGDVIDTVAYSNLDTYVNNYPIRAYYLHGRQVICAEDLRGYGFTVDWNETDRTLTVTPEYDTEYIEYNYDIKNEQNLWHRKAYDVCYSDIVVYLNGEELEAYAIDGQMMIPIRALEDLGRCEYSAEENYSKLFVDGLPEAEYRPLEASYEKKLTIVLDAGHGKSSGLMSDEEKDSEGYYYVNGQWGEWRHWKNGTANVECEGSDCHGDRACWYRIGNGDRDLEPEINLNNTLAAKAYLEQLGYNVRLTRESNDQNPSFTKRVSYCYPDNDLSAVPDASAYICIHSNAGGGRGSAYIAAEGNYTQKWIKSNYVSDCNNLGKIINDRIVTETSLSRHGSGSITNEGYLILFNKCPVPAGYMEIGFFDSSSDLGILNSEYDAIGRAIAYGIDDFFTYSDD